MEDNFLFLDTETTGFGECRMIELAYGRLNGPIQVVRAKPPIPIGKEATIIHGICDKDLADVPAFVAHPEYHLIKATIENSIVVAHNAIFDVEVLAREGIRVEHYIDTRRLAKKIYREFSHHNLQHLRQQLELETEGNAHSAGGDVAVLIALFKRMLVESVVL